MFKLSPSFSNSEQIVLLTFWPFLLFVYNCTPRERLLIMCLLHWIPSADGSLLPGDIQLKRQWHVILYLEIVFGQTHRDLLLSFWECFLLGEKNFLGKTESSCLSISHKFRRYVKAVKTIRIATALWIDFLAFAWRQ